MSGPRISLPVLRCQYCGRKIPQGRVCGYHDDLPALDPGAKT
jgi:hypothetical protein